MVFYPKAKKTNPLWKLTGFLLLTGGASSPVNLTEVVVGRNVTVRYFMSESVVFEFRDIEFIRDGSGEITAIKNKTNKFEIGALENPGDFIKCIEKAKQGLN